jgi:hypothetical protein
MEWAGMKHGKTRRQMEAKLHPFAASTLLDPAVAASDWLVLQRVQKCCIPMHPNLCLRPTRELNS